MAYGFHVHPKEYTADVRGFSFVVERDGDLYKAYKSGKGLTFEDDDASEVINTIISQSPDYGKIFIKIGEYNITSPIRISKPLTLFGEDRHGTILKQSGDVDVVQVDSGYVKICNLKILGDYDTYDGRGINFLSYYRDCNLENLYISKTKREGILLWAGMCFLKNIIVIDCGGFPTDSSYYSSVLLKSSDDIFGVNLDFGGSHRGTGTGRASLDISGCGNIFLNNIRLFGSVWGLFIYEPNSLITIQNFVIDDCEYAFRWGSITHPEYVKISQGRVYNLDYGVMANEPPSGVLLKDIEGYRTENSGVATFSGDGSTTEFKIEHGLAKAPSKYVVSPLTPDAHADKTISVDDTYIIITFSTAPPSGTDNLKFSWWAEV